MSVKIERAREYQQKTWPGSDILSLFSRKVALGSTHTQGEEITHNWGAAEYVTPKYALWYEDYFELKKIKKQQTKKKALCPPPIWLEAQHKFLFVEVFSSPYQEKYNS